MVLTADKRTKKIALEGVPSGVPVELRIQDTSRGNSTTLNLRADSLGVATGSIQDFSFAKSVHAIIKGESIRLTFDAKQPDDGSFRLSDGTSAEPETPQHTAIDLIRAWEESESATTFVGDK